MDSWGLRLDPPLLFFSLFLSLSLPPSSGHTKVVLAVQALVSSTAEDEMSDDDEEDYQEAHAEINASRAPVRGGEGGGVKN